MEQHALKNVNIHLNANVYSYIETSGACIIKLIMAIIYGFHNKLECLSLNTRLGRIGLPGTNILAYYRNPKLRL
jgi:hypothetical protein